MKATRKLIPAIAMLLVSAIVLTSASYAWFTMSKDVSATDMNLTVTAPTNLLIANAYDGTYDITTDLAAQATALNADHKLYPSSSFYGDYFAATKTNSGNGMPSDDATYYYGVTNDSTDLPGQYFYDDYVVYLKTTGDKDVEVAINNLATVTSIAGKTTGDADVAAAKCVRIAVVGAKADAANTDLTAANAATFALANTVTGKNVFTNDTFDDRADAGRTDDAAIDDVVGPMQIDDAKTSAPTAADSWSDYKGVADGDNLIDAYVDGTEVTDADTVFTVKANGKVTAVVIRVWFEGQSDWCYSGISTAQVVANIGFKTVKETTAA